MCHLSHHISERSMMFCVGKGQYKPYTSCIVCTPAFSLSRMTSNCHVDMGHCIDRYNSIHGEQSIMTITISEAITAHDTVTDEKFSEQLAIAED